MATSKKFTFGALFPKSFESLSSANSTAVGLNTTTRACDALHISVETQNLRYRMDGTDPTINTGVVLQKDDEHWLHGYNGTADLKFIRTTGTSNFNVMGYSYQESAK